MTTPDVEAAGAGGWQYRNVARALAIACAWALAGVGLVAVAARLHGVLRWVVAGVGVGVGSLLVFTLVLIAVCWGVVTGTFREQPSVWQRALWVIAAAGAGATCGALAYEVGPAGLFAAPAVLAGVLAALRSVRGGAAYVRRRIVAFAVIATVVATGVGVTIFG